MNQILDKALQRDLRTLALFVDLYCRYRHLGQQKKIADCRICDVQELAGREISLCPACSRLLNHALVKRMHCPMDPKPACKHCPVHCYHPTYRARIQEVMRFSGRQLLFRGRLDYLYHLLF